MDNTMLVAGFAIFMVMLAVFQFTFWAWAERDWRFHFQRPMPRPMRYYMLGITAWCLLLAGGALGTIIYGGT